MRLMVAGREGAANMGDLRTMRPESRALATRLPPQQLGAALAPLRRPRSRADRLFTRAARMIEGQNRCEANQSGALNYGTDLRDTAGVLATGSRGGQPRG